MGVGGHTLSHMCTHVSCILHRQDFFLFSILRALRARVVRAAALDCDRGVQHYMYMKYRDTCSNVPTVGIKPLSVQHVWSACRTCLFILPELCRYL